MVHWQNYFVLIVYSPPFFLKCICVQVRTECLVFLRLVGALVHFPEQIISPKVTLIVTPFTTPVLLRPQHETAQFPE